MAPIILKPGHVDIPVRCTFEKRVGKLKLQIFRGAAAGEMHG